jgi:hypothetical protein
MRLRLPPNSASRRCGRASSSAAGVTERCRALAISRGRAGGPTCAVTECSSAVAVWANVPGDPAAGIAERGLLRRRCGGQCE